MALSPTPPFAPLPSFSFPIVCCPFTLHKKDQDASSPSISLISFFLLRSTEERPRLLFSAINTFLCYPFAAYKRQKDSSFSSIAPIPLFLLLSICRTEETSRFPFPQSLPFTSCSESAFRAHKRYKDFLISLHSEHTRDMKTLAHSSHSSLAPSLPSEHTGTSKDHVLHDTGWLTLWLSSMIKLPKAKTPSGIKTNTITKPIIDSVERQPW